MPENTATPGLSAWLESQGDSHFEARVTLPRPWLDAAEPLEFPVAYTRHQNEVSFAVAGAEFRLDAPVELGTVAIGKPWGQEIWYTGIEARGESRVLDSNGRSVPLSQYLACAPTALTLGRSVLLLKVLDPAPTPVLGDLYFEVHEHKQEVYVVTAVDAQAWPNGAGRIRFGMNQQVRGRFADDDAFRAAYFEAVRTYEQVRRRIDAGDATPTDEQLEQQARAAMESFTTSRDLRVGDVVVVPTWLPHALQHGVRVVEFQTPTYERFIISFAQAVVTQAHWDTERAVADMHIGAPPEPTFERVAEHIERIVAFDDFEVLRAELDVNRSISLDAQRAYAICCAVGGPICVDTLNLEPEQACLVPHLALADTRITAPGAAHCLIALPR